jgi:Protein of unknown function (DUF4079)
MVDINDAIGLLHPAIAAIFVFPFIGIVSYFAWQTRQRRLQTVMVGKSKIPPAVGSNHNRFGKVLAGAVVGLALLGMAHPIFANITTNQIWSKEPFKVVFIVLIFAATIASLVFLYRAKPRFWRGIFATLTGTGLVVLGSQDGVFRREYEWDVSHYYIGLAAAMLMVFSLAIMPDIYQDRSNRWRIVHAVLNSIALLLFVGQGLTGTRDLLEIPLGWQKHYIEQCNFGERTCPSKTSQSQVEKELGVMQALRL